LNHWETRHAWKLLECPVQIKNTEVKAHEESVGALFDHLFESDESLQKVKELLADMLHLSHH